MILYTFIQQSYSVNLSYYFTKLFVRFKLDFEQNDTKLIEENVIGTKKSVII